MAPAPGSKPFSDGYVESSLVARKYTSRVRMEVAERARQLRVVNGCVETNQHGANRGIRWYLAGRRECVICRILRQ